MRIDVYDPAMCFSTGVCGPESPVGPDRLRALVAETTEHSHV